MSKLTKALSYLLLLIMIALMSGCASSGKNTYAQKRKSAARTNTAQLGRNKFFYSTGYQKKLVKTYRNKR